MLDPDAPGPGVITERDILRAVGAGEDPDTELVADHLTSNLTFASPEWSLEQAAAAMVRGGFRHLVVVEGGELAGILSMRDIVRCWTEDGASCEVPASRVGRAGLDALRWRGCPGTAAARAADVARARLASRACQWRGRPQDSSATSRRVSATQRITMITSAISADDR